MILISDKYRNRSELLANRIVRKHIRLIVSEIPFNSINKSTFKELIIINISKDKIEKLYNEMYLSIGKPIFDSIRKKLNSVKFLNENIFSEVMTLWLQQNIGLNIVSVQSTLIQTIIDAISQGYSQNLSTQDIATLLQRQGFYKTQSLRIARTETTTITNLATLFAASDSNLVMDKIWISAQDKRTRRKVFDHLNMNGVTVPYEVDFTVSGEKMGFPGDQTSGLIRTSGGNVINCRCKLGLMPKLGDDGMPIRKT